ncbi:hypothetical protein EBS02_05840, partial [bacterium]|nr:hypothetical protein [bacterium]
TNPLHSYLRDTELTILKDVPSGDLFRFIVLHDIEMVHFTETEDPNITVTRLPEDPSIRYWHFVFYPAGNSGHTLADFIGILSLLKKEKDKYSVNRVLLTDGFLNNETINFKLMKQFFLFELQRMKVEYFPIEGNKVYEIKNLCVCQGTHFVYKKMEKPTEMYIPYFSISNAHSDIPEFKTPLHYPSWTHLYFHQEPTSRFRFHYAIKNLFWNRQEELDLSFLQEDIPWIYHEYKHKYTLYDNIILIKYKVLDREDHSTRVRCFDISDSATLEDIKNLCSENNYKWLDIEEVEDIFHYICLVYHAKRLILNYGSSACTNRFFVNPSAFALVLGNRYYETEYLGLGEEYMKVLPLWYHCSVSQKPECEHVLFSFFMENSFTKDTLTHIVRVLDQTKKSGE